MRKPSPETARLRSEWEQEPCPETQTLVAENTRKAIGVTERDGQLVALGDGVREEWIKMEFETDN